MKKIFFITSLTLFGINLLAQKPARLFINLQGGTNFSKYRLNKNDGNVRYSGEFKNVVSFNLGLGLNYKINNWLLFQSGIGLEGKGSSSKSYGIWFYQQSTTHAYYLTIPFNLLYNTKFKKYFRVFVGSGVSTSFGLFGTNKYEGRHGDIPSYSDSGTDHIQFGKSGNERIGVFSNLKRIDYGVNLLGGLSYKTISFQCQYNFGMQDISTQSDDKGKNRTLSIMIGYRIAK